MMRDYFEKPTMDIMKISNSIYTYPCNVSDEYMNQHYGNNIDAGMAFLYSHCDAFYVERPD